MVIDHDGHRHVTLWVYSAACFCTTVRRFRRWFEGFERFELVTCAVGVQLQKTCLTLRVYVLLSVWLVLVAYMQPNKALFAACTRHLRVLHAL
jgi:hypothetical protein